MTKRGVEGGLFADAKHLARSGAFGNGKRGLLRREAVSG